MQQFQQSKMSYKNGGHITAAAAQTQNMLLQAKLTIGAVDDPLEAEADAMADRVMRIPDRPLVQRKCAECEEEDKNIQRKPLAAQISPFIQTKSSENATPLNESIVQGIESTCGGGEPLPDSTRSFMENRFGADFTAVRIHTHSVAEELSNTLNAQAFTRGNDIYFSNGKFTPETASGRRLLAHELAHTLQQQQAGRQIQRQPKPPFPDKAAEANELEKKILANPAYLNLAADSKSRVVWIIAKAKAKPLGDAKGQRNYYLKKLEIAITTPFNGKETGKAEYGCSPDAEKKNREAVNKALEIEKLWGGAYSDADETIVASGTNKVTRTGQGGKTFTVDRSVPRNIRVKMKVKLNGKADEVGSIKKLEDAIERAVSIDTKGYYLDIEFVDTSGPDVFEFTVNFCLWANSGNWASGPVTLSHEVHHALGLPDRYDYIESHAANPLMNVPMRLVWFVEQMKKAGGPRDPFSKMESSVNPLLSEDICAVAFPEGPERKKCIEARRDLDPVGIPPI